ncbi:MAG TPA: hypothetical protein DEB15_09235, partial [Pusillimonas sp.]|nr:hypothetical protein [Pusillimonas sp.]
WPSWPQACIFPSFLLACSNVFVSCMGSASMSARNPTALPLSVRPVMVPTTPVIPRPRCTGMPQACRLLATTSAVRTSSYANSGCAWISRRSAVISSFQAMSGSISFMIKTCSSARTKTTLTGRQPWCEALWRDFCWRRTRNRR